MFTSGGDEKNVFEDVKLGLTEFELSLSSLSNEKDVDGRVRIQPFTPLKNTSLHRSAQFHQHYLVFFLTINK